MKKIWFILLSILMIPFVTSCGKNKNGKSRIKNFNKYSGIGIYNSGKKKSMNNEVRMIQFEGEKSQIKVDLKLCGFKGDKRENVSIEGENPFVGKSIARCSFFENYAFFMVSKADIYVSETEYDSYVSDKTNASILTKQSSNDELYVLSLKTGNFYDFGDTFEEIDLSNKRAEGSNNIVINANKNGNKSYYLLREADDDIILKKLPSIEEVSFMDKYDNIYYGSRYIKHDDETLTLKDTGLGQYSFGLTLTKQCFCVSNHLLFDIHGLPVAYENGFKFGKYDDGSFDDTSLYLFNEEGIGQKYNTSDDNELIVNIAYCSISNSLNNDKYSCMIDDVLSTPLGTYEVIYDTNSVLGYKLKVINANLKNGLFDPEKCGANKNGAIGINYDTNIVIYDNAYIKELVDEYKNLSDKSINFRDYCSEHDKALDVDGLKMNSLTNRLVGNEIRIYFEGYKDDKLCYGYIDEDFKIVYNDSESRNYNETIIIHKVN